MKTYKEEDLRFAFRAGVIRGRFLEEDQYAPFTTSLDEDGYIERLGGKESIREKLKYELSILGLSQEDLTAVNLIVKSL